MPDPLYLSLWFPTFRAEEMLGCALPILQQFPFASASPGVTYFAVQPISWAEPSILERRFVPPATPQQAIEAAQDFAHDDYCITFEAYWELWAPAVKGGDVISAAVSQGSLESEQSHASSAGGPAWSRQESKVSFILHGTEFDEGIYTEHGHIEIDFGLDHPFLHEEMDLSPADQQRVRDNIAQLTAFTQRLEKHCHLTGRVLWSESEANLAQKLVARLQRVQ